MVSKSRRAFLAGTLGAATIPLAGCWSDDTTPVATRYQTAALRVVAKYRMPGALASVRVPGEPEWKQAFGHSDIASRTPTDPLGHYSIRSVTKSYAVTLILQLVREKRLALDDNLDAFVPGVPNGASITIADLAGMQSGIAEYTTSKAFLADWEKDFARPFTEDQLVAYAVPLSPKFAPGTEYEYSNTNTVLLGMIVEKITGQSMAQALEARIFAPLALHDTMYPYVVPLPAPHPTPYDVDFVTGATEVLPLISPTLLAAAGAMVSTIDDMQTWGRALGDGRLIGAELQLERINRSRPATNGPTYDRYGLGIGILDGWWGHTGDGVGFQAATFYDPQTLATIAVLVNATPGNNPPFLNYAEEVFRALAEVIASR